MERMTNDSIKLVEDNYKIFYKFFSMNHIYDEDVQQHLICSVCQYMNSYDSSKSKISSFMFYIMNCQLKSYYNFYGYVYNGQEVSFEELEDEGLFIGEEDIGILNISESRGIFKLFDENLEKIKSSKRNKSIYYDKMINEMTAEQLSKKYNLSISRINSILANLNHFMKVKFKNIIEY